MPFDVTLPDHIPGPEEANASSESPSGSTPSGSEAPSGSAFQDVSHETKEEAKAEAAPQSQQMRDFTADELEKLLGVEKPQVSPDIQRFNDNFPADMVALVRDPSLWSKFTQIYPAQFVERARELLNQRGINANQQPGNQQPQKLTPEMEYLMRFAKDFESQQKQARVEAIGQKIDTAFSKMATKYPDADPDKVNWYLQGLTQKGVSIMDAQGNLRMGIVEKLFKQENEKFNSRYQAKYKALVDAQKKANNQSRDMGTGGAMTSGPGVAARTIKEATKNLLADIAAAK